MRAIAGRVLIIVGLLAALSLPVSLTACGGSSNQRGGTPSTQSEEASENDSIESTREEEIEQQRGEEASENDSIESTREEQIESSQTTP